ncbi:MAG: XdhC family protein [Rhizobiales bacterium]|nr:XdhC family protein [Hyphomicrobiales bacterium]MBO6698771.1 XdhC family protein [Hyphomicrobiales bacterium]MBO6734976.1 XdhC family protein [Hyphomicrobiales bacterium]MBO6911218.1 XdhC family protein [Hyphomicrobiales bacterium]MBO6955778.1 XdhC family protein [Hyphomicrobiales bacterium]
MLTLTPPTRDPIDAVLDAPGDAVLAVIAGVEGPSYRPVGAMMAVFPPERRVGTLSSGCIESDIALHAMEAAEAGRPRMLRYGRGSPYMDIQLPCGGGLDILLLPSPDQAALGQIKKNRSARVACSLRIDTETGAMEVVESGLTHRDGNQLTVRFEPDIRFLVFGKGPEASTFAALVQSAGYPNLLLSPDVETLDHGSVAGCETRHLTTQAFPADLAADDRTAIVLFFHDHDWEPPILAGALGTSAFYIGAQGSQRARDARLQALQLMGIESVSLARLHGPVGLIPSARDAGTLAVSVLAEVLGKAMSVANTEAA